MADKLTAKQTAFVKALLSGKTQVDAYRDAYDVSGMSDNAQRVEASRLCQHPTISLMLKEATQASREKLKITADLLNEMSMETYALARSAGNASHMTGAIMALARINGLIVDKSERKIEQVRVAGSRDEMLAELNKLAGEMNITIHDASEGESNKKVH